MGEMADLLNEGFYEDPDDYYDDTYDSPLICRHCQQSNLEWKFVKYQWVMFELDGKPHSCKGYEPAIEVMKELAKLSTNLRKTELLNQLIVDLEDGKSINTKVKYLSNSQLIDIYSELVISKECSKQDTLWQTWGVDAYGTHIATVKKILLTRMK